MASKLQFYSAVSEQTVSDIIAKRGNWMNFLDTAARFYKYSFPDQLMIYAQRPNATACALMETWNDSFSRWIRRGAKGIALIDDSGSYPKLKYVFDVADTEPTIQNSRPVNLWEMRQEHKAPVLEALAKTYDDVDDTLADSFHNIAKQLASEYYGDNAREIRYRAEGSYLEDFDDYNLGVAFENALSVSIAYTLMSRCGFDTADHFDDDDFNHIIEFNTPDMVYALGTATSELSEQVLRDIEIVIKKYERQHTAERSVTHERTNNIQQSRGLSSAQPDTRGAADGVDGTPRTLREETQSVSERASDNDVQRPAPVGEVVPTSTGSGGSGERETDTGDERLDRAEHTARQGDRSDGLDGGNERAESGGGGNGLERADLRVLEKQAQAEISAGGAVDETAPISMAELAQLHTDWNEHINNGVLQDKAIISAAVNGDKENTLIAIDAAIKRMRVELNQKLMASASTKGKIAYLTELDLYLFKDWKPPLREQLYDTVIRSDIYKEELSKKVEPSVLEAPKSENKTPREQKSSLSDGVSAAEETYSQVGNSLPEILSRSSVTLDEVDAILRDGGNFDSHKLNHVPFNSRSALRIAARFSKDITVQELTSFLRREYLRGLYSRAENQSGKGFDFGNHHVCAWYSEYGIQLAIGVTAKNNIHAVTIPWEQAALRIKELMLSGQYITIDAFDSAIDNERHELASALWDFYRDDMHGIPEEWHGEEYGHPGDVEKIKSLLDNDSERQAILDRLETDVEAWNNDLGSRSWHNPNRLLADMRDAMLTPVVFPTSDVIETKNFSYFITQDEIDALLTYGSDYAEGKLRILSFFLGEHDSKETVDFIKREYGHGGGTWNETNGWRNSEPGKGVTLQRGTIGKPDAEVNLKWNAVIKRTEQLILEGRYMTRSELDYIPKYERLALIRCVNNFFYELPEEYERPFPGKSGLFSNEYYDENGERTLNFTYPHEAEWQAIRDFLDNPERVDKMLAQMERVYVNTPEEDRFYHLRKTGFERLSAYRDGTYTLFPNLETLPDPEAPIRIVMQSKPVIHPPPTSVEQMSLFGGEPDLIADTPLPILPSVAEQQAKIEQSSAPTVEAIAPAVSLPITQDEIDALLMSISDDDKERITARFADNPRSREAVQLVREIYGSIEETMPRIDGADGYMGILGEKTGIAIAKGTPASTPERPPAETLALSMTAVHKRVAELVADSRLVIAGQNRAEQSIEPQIENEGKSEVETAPNTVTAESETPPVSAAEHKPTSRDLGGGFVILQTQRNAYSKEETETAAAKIDSVLYGALADDNFFNSTTKSNIADLLAHGILKHTAPDYLRQITDYGSANNGILLPDGRKAAYCVDNRGVFVTTDADLIFDFHLRHSNSFGILPGAKMFTWEQAFNAVFTLCEHQLDGFALSEETQRMLDAEQPTTGEAPSTDVSLVDMVRQELDGRGFVVSDELIDTGLMEYEAHGGKGNFQDVADYIENEFLSEEEPEQELVPEDVTPQVENFVAPVERGRSYAVGDTVYLENDKPFILERIGDSVSLSDPSLHYPILRSESRDNFERLLRRNPLNQHFTDYILADLNEANGDLLDVLNNGLFDSDGKKNVLWRLGNGATNYELAVHLSDFFHIPPGTMTLTTGETAEYSSTVSGVFIDIDDKSNTKLSFSWADIAPILRTLEPQWLALRDAEQKELVTVAEPVMPVAEKLFEELSPSGAETTAYYLFRHPDGVDENAVLSHGTLSLIKEKADVYVICAEVCYLSEDDMAKWNIGFRKMPRDWNLLPNEVQEKIRAVKPEYEKQWQELYGKQAQPFMVIDNIARNNFNLFALAFPQIANGFYQSMSFQNEENGHKLEIWHDSAKTGKIEFEISYDSPSGIKVYEPMATFQMNFENRMLKLENYENTITGENIGYLHSRSPDDEQRLSGLEVKIYELLVGIKEQGFKPVTAIPFKDAEGKPLPAEPKRDITGFLKEQSDRFINDSAGLENAIPEDFQQTLFTAAPKPVDTRVQAPAHKPVIVSAGTNFRITDDHLGEGGAKTKFHYNIDAINILRAIEQEKRAATPDEQQILARYVGWGGLPQAFDAENKQWANEYRELTALLSPKEFESARASTLNAHYTSPTVIRAIFEFVENMGFKRGNVLEPALGVGNFFGLLPDSMNGSNLYGVELDGMTARIAKKLYPKANIKATGFENTDMPDAFFDLAIGNVPFGDYGIVDKRYDKHRFKVHDYFFAKTLDQVRPGGVIAFITSKGTLDKQNPEVRKYIAQRAELLGAVRLPNTAFLKNAGTEVTSDIIFLQKRDRPIDIEPDWVHLGMTEDGIPVNRYFADNPEMILGTMSKDDGVRMYGSADSTTCIPFEGADLAEQLKTALLNVRGQYAEPELDDIEGIDNHAIPADTHVKNFSYALVTPATEPDNADGQIYAAKIGEGQVYFRENSLMYPVQLPATTLERIKGMIGLRDCVHRLIELQLHDYDDFEIQRQQDELNALYDAFTADYGLINSQANSRAFSADSAYYLLCSLEMLDEDNNLERKADMFTKRTIKQRTVITHVDTSSEALAVSLGERACIDIEYMAQLTGFSPEKIIRDLEGVIFFDFGNPNRAIPNFDPEKMKLYEKFPLITADAYLSGNVREKLRKAKMFNETVGDEFHGFNTTVNITALESAQPQDLTASEIAVRLGSTWIDPQYVQEFVYETLKTPMRMQSVYQVHYHAYTGEWQISNKGRALYNDINATVTYGTSRMNAYEIICDTLNLRDVRVYDYKEDADGKEKRVLNKKETTLAQQKQEQVKQAFKDWIWKDPQRRQTLVALYNERFNSVRPREYDGSHITFSGISPEISLRPHQLGAIAHILYGGNTLLAHVVGAGKTFEMVGAAMEAKRLGLCNKSLFAVPNHLTEQWAGEFLRLYPSANILVATKKDFEMRNRKKFCAKIATGDYDAVIIGHSQLEKIPMSRERQERLLNEQISEIEDGIDELKRSDGERFSIKQLEKTRKSLDARLKKLTDGKSRDDVVTYEQLGVDRLFVDEAHSFKNLFLYTKMRNVAGLSTSEAQKSSDLFMKCRYMDELTGNKGIIFATGTPISNSMTEMYTMQRYLQYDTLVDKNLTHFDCWASTFGETQTSIELAPEGTGYRARTRFAKFHNLPELMCMFKEVADIQTADMLNLPVPVAKYETVIVEPSDVQKEMVQELSERAAAVHAQLVDPKTDNMLKITTDGRKIGLDQRLINPLLPDFEGSKVNACANNVFNLWETTRDERLTQLVFCDFSTPNKDGRFNIYDDIKAKLLNRGIPEHEIAFIHDADTETRKKEMFAKVRQGKVRILFGSTFKMGAGTNVQDRLKAIHDADCPWRPADLEQRAGRIVRQGNKNAEVQIFRYATSGTFDSYLWQTVESKQKFIAQIMSSKSPVRSCEDVDETALSYAEIKALCAGNPMIKEKMDLDIEVARLRLLKSEYQSQHYRLEDDLLKHFPQQITEVTARIAGIEKDLALYAAEKEKTVDLQPSLTGGATTVTSKFPGMTINGVEYTEKEPAAKALFDAVKDAIVRIEQDKGIDKQNVPIGSYMGFDMSLQFSSFGSLKNILLRGNMTYQAELGTDVFGNITRINNLLADFPKRLEGAKAQLDTLNSQQEAARLELEKPFLLADELAEKEARLALLNADLNIEGTGDLDVADDADGRDEIAVSDLISSGNECRDDYSPRYASAKSARPSLLDGIRSYSAEIHQGASGKKITERDI